VGAVFGRDAAIVIDAVSAGASDEEAVATEVENDDSRAVYRP